MSIDENQFFRNATMRLCGSLDMEEALFQFLIYLRDFIPADFIAMTYLSQKSGGFHAIASATVEGGNKLDIFLPLPNDKISMQIKSIQPQVIIVKNPKDHPVLKHTVHHASLNSPSIIIIRPTMEGKYLGTLTIMAEGENRYTQEHVRLLSLLREPAYIALSNSLRYIEVLKLKELLADDNRYLHDELNMQCSEDIVGIEFGLKNVMELSRQVAPLNSPVILYGETGTGKEVIARAIHNLSPRRDNPFIKVNCGAIPENLVDSELFGHEKGSFTGAISQKRGRFERANKGTIFLDEIGELSLEAQVRLLRVLQEGELERVGGTQSLKVDVRILAATHRDLQKMILKGKFREDLFFRLQVFPIIIPPLRDRAGDIPELTQHFISKKSREMGLDRYPSLAENSLEQLRSYHWPGNVRELENAVERAIILCDNKPLIFDFIYSESKNHIISEDDKKPENSFSLDNAIRDQLILALKQTNGTISGDHGAAKLLGMNPSTLRAKLRKLGIPFGRNAHLKGQ
jgi:transcriptional regulator with GAF, ATPase, and Fis domain